MTRLHISGDNSMSGLNVWVQSEKFHDIRLSRSRGRDESIATTMQNVLRTRR